MRVKDPILLVVLPMHLVEVRAEVPNNRLEIVGPVAKGRDVLLHLYACVELLLQDINLVWESARQKLLMIRGKIRRPGEEKAVRGKYSAGGRLHEDDNGARGTRSKYALRKSTR